MNLFEMQERLKDFSKDQLVQEMQMPSGTAPPFLVLTELQRRTRMEQAMKADGQGAPQSTVAEDAVASAGVPQGGLQQMAQALAPRTDMTQNDGAAPVAAMQEGGMVESNAAQVQSVIDQVMGGGAASPMVPQMMSYAQRAAQLPQMAPPMQATPTMPASAPSFFETMGLDPTPRPPELIAALDKYNSGPGWAGGAPGGSAAPADALQATQVPQRRYVQPPPSFRPGVDPEPLYFQPTAPMPTDLTGLSQRELVAILRTAPDLATRRAARTAMRAGPEEESEDVTPSWMKRDPADNRAKGGVIRYQEGGRIDMAQAVATDPTVIAMANRMGMSVQQYLENLDPEARRQFVRNAERRANMDLSEDDAAYGEFMDRTQNYLDLPPQSDLDARFSAQQQDERLGLSGIPRSLQAPEEDEAPDSPASLRSYRRQLQDMGAQSMGPGARIQPPTMQSDLPGTRFAAMSREGEGVEPYTMLEAPAARNVEPNIDTTDDARAARGLGRSPLLSGLEDPGSGDDIRSLLQRIGSGTSVSGGSGGRRDTRTPSMVDTTDDARAARRFATDEAAQPPMAMSAGEVGAPRPSAVPEFVTDPGTPMDRAARESAAEAAALRDDAGIEESLRTPEDQAAAAAAARAGVAAPARQTAPTGAGGGAGGIPGATGVPANAEMSDNERLFNQDKWLALARVGLGLMASQAPTFGQALGEAGMAGVDALASAREDYLERKQAEELMAMRRAAMSARGAGGGGGGGGAMPSLEFDLSAGENRALEVGEKRIADLELELLNLGDDPGSGFLGFGGPNEDWEKRRNEIERKLTLARAAREATLRRLEIAALGGSFARSPENRDVVNYDISGEG